MSFAVTSVELNIIICAILDVLFVLMYNNTGNNKKGIVGEIALIA